MFKRNNATLSYTNELFFGLNDKAFRTKVTLTNTGLDTLQNVRYMRDVNPNIALDMGGVSAKLNKIERTIAGGDSFCAVSALSSNGTDPYYVRAGKRAAMVFASHDCRCRVSFGASLDPNTNYLPMSMYDSLTYDKPLAKGYTKTEDFSMFITFHLGTLNPGASTTLTYYTALDAGNVDDVIKLIKGLQGVCTGPVLSCAFHSLMLFAPNIHNSDIPDGWQLRAEAFV